MVTITLAITVSCVIQASPLPALTPHQESTIVNGPLLYWTFADCQSSTIFDFAGQSDGQGVGRIEVLSPGPFPAGFHALRFHGGDAGVLAINPDALALTTTFDTLASHQLNPVGQGVATDEEFLYAFNTTTVQKRRLDPPFELIIENNDVLSDVPGANHIGDGVHLNGSIYIPVEQWNGGCQFALQHIVRLSADDLSVLDVWDVSQQNHEVSGIGFNGEHLVVSSFCDGSRLWKYDPVTGEFVDSLAIEENIPRINGITYDAVDKLYYITSADINPDLGRILAVSESGEIINDLLLKPDSVCTKLEGVDFQPPRTLYYSMAVGAGCGARFFIAEKPDAFTHGFTVEFMLFPEETATTQAVMEYRETGADVGLSFTIQNDLLIFSAEVATGGSASVFATISPLQWTHVVGRFDSGSGSLTLFINGESKSTTSVDLPFASPQPQLYVGNFVNPSMQDGFLGAMANVVWFKSALPDSAVSARYTDAMTSVQGDLTLDGVVNGADLASLLAQWGPCTSLTPCNSDLNMDGVIDGSDLAALLSSWSNSK